MAEAQTWWQKQRIRQETRDEGEFIGNFKMPSEKRVSKAKDRKVDFVVAGTQKAGSTALDAYLRLNPEICMPQRVKEVNFFDTDALFASGEPDYRLYHSFFKPKKSHRLLGDASPDYMYNEAAARRFHVYNPDLKIIISLRNPIERAYSHWNMFRQLGIETLGFGEAMRAEEDRSRATRREGKPPRFCYVDRGYYVEQIRRLRRYFPPAQMLIIKQEELRDNHSLILNSVWDFLGLEPLAAVESLEVLVANYPGPMSDADCNFLRELYRLEIGILEDVLGWDCSDWLA